MGGAEYNDNAIYDLLNKKQQQKQQNVQNAVSGQKRVIELNNSYQKRYTAYTNIIIAFIVCIRLFI